MDENLIKLKHLRQAATAANGRISEVASTAAEAIEEVAAAKQDKLSGLPGQVVGFDSNGNAIPQDAPSGGGGTGDEPAYGWWTGSDVIQDDLPSHVSQSTIFNNDAQFRGYGAFEMFTAYGWRTKSTDTSPWISIDLEKKITIDGLRIVSYTNSDNIRYSNPSHGIIAGSNDGENWNDVASFEGLDRTADGSKKDITFHSTVPYRFYKLYDMDSGYVSILKIMFHSQKSGGVSFTTDETLSLSDTGVLSVTTPVVPLEKSEYDSLPEEKQQAQAVYLVDNGDTASKRYINYYHGEMVGGSGGSSDSGGEVYSEEEVVIGVWCGKPLYRKVFKGDGFSGRKLISGLSIDTVVNAAGAVKVNFPEATWTLAPIAKPSDNFWVDTQGENLCLYANGSYANHQYHIAVDYVKTTDEPGGDSLR